MIREPGEKLRLVSLKSRQTADLLKNCRFSCSNARRGLFVVEKMDFITGI
jgi:hypothetical protein